MNNEIWEKERKESIKELEKAIKQRDDAAKELANVTRQAQAMFAQLTLWQRVKMWFRGR